MKTTFCASNPNYFDPWEKKKKSKTGVPTLRNLALKKSTNMRLSSFENSPYGIIQEVSCKKIQDMYKKKYKSKISCMDILKNPRKYVKRKVKDCLIKYISFLDDDEKDNVFEGTKQHLDKLSNLNQDDYIRIITSSEYDKKITTQILNLLTKDELVDIIHINLDYRIQSSFCSN
jgi:hypothetical protein